MAWRRIGHNHHSRNKIQLSIASCGGAETVKSCAIALLGIAAALAVMAGIWGLVVGNHDPTSNPNATPAHDDKTARSYTVHSVTEGTSQPGNRPMPTRV